MNCACFHIASLAAAGASSVADIVWWAVALILLVLLLGVGVLLAKQKLLRKKDDPNAPIYTLHQLRKMLKRGEISQQEFEKLKEIVNSQTRRTGPLSG